MDIVLEVHDKTNNIVYTSRLRHHVDWVYVKPQQQSTKYNCGAAVVQMMVHYITNDEYSQDTIGMQSKMADYRSRANELISGNKAKGNPYTSVCHSTSDTYSSYRNASLGPDM